MKAAAGTRSSCLGDDEPLAWAQEGSGVAVRLGSRLPEGPAVCLKITPEPSGL